ncbi:MAG: hydrogenase nickel incorporation protein HypB [Bacillota bacterium]|jgi:hydrogenase nickel incorporation protein HypB
MRVVLRSKVLQSNEQAAVANRELFGKHGLAVINMMSSPGSGKTTILEQTARTLQGEVKIGVIEGDIQSTLDAERIAASGAEAVQINTEGACHLDASMVAAAVQELPMSELDLIVVENVGNLVCPAEFDLGEDARVIVLSVTEGNDKPLKYPVMFRQATAIVVNKVDLIEHTDFDRAALEQDIKDLNPRAQLFWVSARTGEGIGEWCEWLKRRVAIRRGSAAGV